MKKCFGLFAGICLILPVLLAGSLSAQAHINYAEALQKSLYFYDAEKSGPGISSGRLQWRGDSEVEDSRILLKPVSGDVGVNISQGFIDANRTSLDPDGDGTLDLSGGFHDAGDHVKFGLPQAYAASTLGWSFYEFREAFVRIGEEEHMLEILKWFSDYFLRSTFKDGDGHIVAFNYQVGDGDVDHDYWGPPELQDPEVFPRPAFLATADTPASDQCAGAAAALAIMYLNYGNVDVSYASECLDTAVRLYDFAVATRGLGYSGGFYTSSYDQDELAWAAVWLYIATGDYNYITDIIKVGADGYYTGWLSKIIVSTQDTWQNIWVHSWDTVWGGVFAKLAPITMDPHHWYIFRWNLEYWTGFGDYQVKHAASTDMSYLATSPDGFSFLNSWGSARYNAAAQLQALVYQKYASVTPDPNGGSSNDFQPWAEDQMRYIMGENPMGRSYIVGYSSEYARHPHHRAAHGSKNNSMDEPAEHRHTLWGALVGGPDMDDFHKDLTSDYIYNEVAIDYNAGFVGALAGHLLNGYAVGHQPVVAFPPLEAPVDAYYAEARLEQENSQRTQITVTLHNESVHPPSWETGLKFRYFFNITELIQAGQSIADVSMEIYYDENGMGYDGYISCTGPYPFDEAAGLYYVEFDYAGYKVYGERELHFGLISAQSPSFQTFWDPSNDWSRQGIGAANTVNPHIPVYLNGSLVFGEEPSNATPGPSGGPTPTPTIPQAAVISGQYKCGAADISSNQVKPQLRLVNKGTVGVPLSELTVRYYYTADSSESQQVNVDYAQVGEGNITGTFGQGYVEIGFAAAAGILAAGSNSGEIQLRISKEGFIPYDQSNDYSFDATALNFADYDKITIYRNGTRIWGTPPDGPEPTPTAIPLCLLSGDVNQSGTVDIVDALMTAQYYVGLNPPGFGIPCADVNCDGMVNIVDALITAQYYVGLLSHFPC